VEMLARIYRCTPCISCVRDLLLLGAVCSCRSITACVCVSYSALSVKGLCAGLSRALVAPPGPGRQHVPWLCHTGHQ
jgi:hypothetical protein